MRVVIEPKEPGQSLPDAAIRACDLVKAMCEYDRRWTNSPHMEYVFLWHGHAVPINIKRTYHEMLAQLVSDTHLDIAKSRMELR